MMNCDVWNGHIKGKNMEASIERKGDRTLLHVCMDGNTRTLEFGWDGDATQLLSELTSYQRLRNLRI